MKVKELIEQLKLLEDDELDVYVFADHGQTYIKGGHCSVEKIHLSEKDDYYIEEVVHSYDIVEDYDYVNICVISD